MSRGLLLGFSSIFFIIPTGLVAAAMMIRRAKTHRIAAERRPMRKGLWNGLLVLLVTITAGLITLWMIEQRARTYRVAADRYDEYAKAYGNITPMNSPYIGYSTCYGEEWDSFTDKVEADVTAHSGNRAYLLNRFEMYKRLKQRYEQAVAKPWVVLPDGPPPRP